MLIPDVPPPNQAGEISQAELNRQKSDDDLTRENWRLFRATKDKQQEVSPAPGTPRREV